MDCFCIIALHFIASLPLINVWKSLFAERLGRKSGYIKKIQFVQQCVVVFYLITWHSGHWLAELHHKMFHSENREFLSNFPDHFFTLWLGIWYSWGKSHYLSGAGKAFSWCFWVTFCFLEEWRSCSIFQLLPLGESKVRTQIAAHSCGWSSACTVWAEGGRFPALVLWQLCYMGFWECLNGQETKPTGFWLGSIIGTLASWYYPEAVFALEMCLWRRLAGCSPPSHASSWCPVWKRIPAAGQTPVLPGSVSLSSAASLQPFHKAVGLWGRCLSCPGMHSSTPCSPLSRGQQTGAQLAEPAANQN